MRLCCPALISTPAHPASIAIRVASAKPATTVLDVVVLHLLGHLAAGDLRHRRRPPQLALRVRAAALQSGVPEPGEHGRAVRAARGDDRRPSPAAQSAASGARSYGQSSG